MMEIQFQALKNLRKDKIYTSLNEYSWNYDAFNNYDIFLIVQIDGCFRHYRC